MTDRINAQRLRRQARRILGLCVFCGNSTGRVDENGKLPPSACGKCRKVQRNYKRKTLNLKPWRKGKRGRPPIKGDS